MKTKHHEINEFEVKNILLFTLFVVGSFLMHHHADFQIFKYTFKTFEVFFHEASHSIVAMAFNRSIVEFNLDFNGSGHIGHFGASDIGKIFTSFSGYFGASIWGFLIYISALYNQRWIKIPIVLFMSAFIIVAKNLETMLIIIGMMSLMVILWRIKSKEFSNGILRFIGVFIIVSAIYSPTYLFNYSDSGDHISMSEYTLIPSLIWIIIWTVFSTFLLYKSFKITLNKRTKKCQTTKKKEKNLVSNL